MKFERDAWQRHSSDGEFQSLGREDQKKVIDAELTYMRPLILSKAKLNEVRNRIEEIQEKKGAEGGIKEAGMLVYENWLYKDDLASYWQRMKQLEKEEKGNQEVIQMARQGKTLSEIRNEYADSENIQMAFKQPELKFLYNQDAIQSAIANGKTAVEIDGEHYDISSEDRIRELVIGNYMSTAQAHEGLKNWAEANNYYLAMLKLTMGDDDYKTLEEAIKAHPDLVYFKTYFLSSSEFTEGTLLYAYPDEVKELIRTGQVNEKLLEAYINNKERMNSNSVDVRGVAELILPKDYWQVALNLLPEARGTFIVAKAATGTVVRQATKIMLKESAHLAAVAITGFGPKGGAEGAERLLALKSREGMASALEKIEIEGTWKGLVNPPTLERPRLDLPAAALTGCDVCAGSIPTLEDAENMARRIADGTATEKEISDYARSLAAAYNEGLIGDAGIDAQARLIEDAKIRGGYAATGGTETAKTVPEEIRKAADDYASGKADVSEFERAQQQLMESFVAGDIDQSQFGELKAALEDAQMRRIELEDSARGIAKGASHAEKEGYLAAEARDEIVEQFEKQSGEIGETAAARQTVTDYGDELVEEINEKFDDFQKEASVTFKSEEMLDEATLKEDYIDRLLGDHGLTSGKITPVSDLERDRLAETILALKEDGFKDDEIQYLVELVLFQSREGAATSLANHGISHLADDYLSLRKLMEEAGFSPTPDQRKAIAQGAILHDIGYTSDVMNWGKGNVHGLSFTKAHPELGREFITAPATAAKLKAMYDNPETAGEMLKIVDSMAGEHAVVSRDFLDAANCLPKCSPEQEKDMIVRMFGLVDDAGVGKDTTLMQDADVWGELLEMKGDPPKATFNEEGMQRLKVQYGCGEIPKPPSCVALDTMSAGTFSFNGPRLAVSPKSEIKIVARDGKRVAVVEIEYSQEAIGLMYDVGIARKPYYTASDFPCDAPCEDNMMRALRGEDPYGNGQVRLGINSAGVELWAKNFHIGCEETLLGRDVCRTLMRK
ncbi:hypothetical protein HYV82_04845 [Candidatus Woesearchaeota archaeon]|nr:hypothetical protein [Candidatus Woesearchaeota archaeon]